MRTAIMVLFLLFAWPVLTVCASAESTQTLKFPPVVRDLTAKDAVLCFETSLDPGLIVRMTAETMPDVPYILFLSICAHPASHRETNDEFAYKCRLPELRDQGLDLPEAPACEDDRQVFNYEFKGGSGSEFRLPEGTGLPVGPGTALEQMVGFVRFPVTGDNRTIAGPVLEVGLVAPSDDTIPISALVLESYGFVDRMSVASVSGSWTLEQEMRMHLRLLHLHTHETAIDVVVWIETTSGGKEVVLRQNPRSFSGVVDVSDSSSAVLRHGDRLVVQCTFNNTKEHKLRVEDEEMCELNAYYTTEGQATLMTPFIVSMDPFYKECMLAFVHLPAWTVLNYDGVCSFHGNVTSEDCM